MTHQLKIKNNGGRKILHSLFYLPNVELLWELIEDGGITVLVLLDDRDNEGDELMPKVNTLQAWPLLPTLLLLRGIHLMMIEEIMKDIITKNES